MTTSRFITLLIGGLLLAGSAPACGSCGESNKAEKEKDKGSDDNNNGGRPHASWDGGKRVFKAFGDGGHHYRGRHLAGDGGPSPIEGDQPQ